MQKKQKRVQEFRHINRESRFRDANIVAVQNTQITRLALPPRDTVCERVAHRPKRVDQ